MPATITIPPHYWAGSTQIEFLLTDSAGRMYPAELSNASGFVGGRQIITVDDTGASFTLPTNDEMPSAPGDGSNPSTWTIRVQQGRYQAFYRVSISSLNPPTNWNELIEAGTPVDPYDIWSSRLWPPDGISNVGFYGRVAIDGSIEYVPPPSGTGDVSGPASSIPGNMAVFGDATGKNIVDGGPPGGAGGATDLSNTPFAGFVRIESSTGTNTDVLAATQALAGVLSATDKATLDGTDAAGTARPPTAHAATHAAGQPDEITPAAIGADPAGSGAAAVATHEGNFVHTRIPSAAQSDALNASPLLSAANRVAGVDDIIANLGNVPAVSTVTVTSSAGTDTILPSATGSLAGVLAAADFLKIQNAAPQTGVDGIAYRQLDGGWVADPLQNDAPSDTQEYVRKDGNWVVGSASADRLVGVTANDTTPGHLQDKVQSGDNSVIFSVINPGANEILDLQATGAGGGEANVGSNVGGGVEIYKGKNGVALELRTLASTATIEPSLNVDLIELNVPANTFDAFGSAQIVSDDLTTHKTSGDHDSRYVQTAPSDGNHYGQRDGNWEITPVSPIGAVWTNYTWSSDTTATSPAVGGIKVNNADHTQATALYVHSTTSGGNNADHIWGSLQVADYLGVWETQSDREGIYYQVTGVPVDNSGWWTIPIAVVPGSLGGMENGQSVNAFTVRDPRNRNPVGGILNQFLRKVSATNHDTEWFTITPASIGAVPETRNINTSDGIQGGGDQTQDRTHSLTDTGVNPGAYSSANITVDVKGRITAAANGSLLHADLTDTSTDGHPGTVINIPGGIQGNAVSIAANGTLVDSGTPPGGTGTTNLSNTPSATEVTVESSNGTDTSIVGASITLAGMMVATDKLKLDGIASGAQVNTVDDVSGSNSISIAPTTGSPVAQLVNDQASPGNLKYYGTSGAGTKGFHDLPSGGSAHVVQDEGTPLPQRANLNFVGAGVTATDDFDNNATVVTIPGGVGGAGDAVVWEITQPGHPFTTIGQPIYSSDGATWANAAADDAATVHVAVTAEIVSPSVFKAQLSGILTGITAATLTPGTYYYLADNGTLSATPGTINAPVLLALTATSALILPYRAGEAGSAGVPPNAHLDGYTEQGDTTTLPGTGTVTVPMDSRIYEITQTGDITFAFGVKPTPPITASTVVMLKGNGVNSVTPPGSTFWPASGPVTPGGAGTITRYVFSLSPSGDQIIDAEVLTST